MSAQVANVGPQPAVQRPSPIPNSTQKIPRKQLSQKEAPNIQQPDMNVSAYQALHDNSAPQTSPQPTSPLKDMPLPASMQPQQQQQQQQQPSHPQPMTGQNTNQFHVQQTSFTAHTYNPAPFAANMQPGQPPFPAHIAQQPGISQGNAQTQFTVTTAVVNQPGTLQSPQYARTQSAPNIPYHQPIPGQLQQSTAQTHGSHAANQVPVGAMQSQNPPQSLMNNQNYNGPVQYIQVPNHQNPGQMQFMPTLVQTASAPAQPGVIDREKTRAQLGKLNPMPIMKQLYRHEGVRKMAAVTGVIGNEILAFTTGVNPLKDTTGIMNANNTRRARKAQQKAIQGNAEQNATQQLLANQQNRNLLQPQQQPQAQYSQGQQQPQQQQGQAQQQMQFQGGQTRQLEPQPLHPQQFQPQQMHAHTQQIQMQQAQNMNPQYVQYQQMLQGQHQALNQQQFNQPPNFQPHVLQQQPLNPQAQHIQVQQSFYGQQPSQAQQLAYQQQLQQVQQQQVLQHVPQQQQMPQQQNSQNAAQANCHPTPSHAVTPLQQAGPNELPKPHQSPALDSSNGNSPMANGEPRIIQNANMTPLQSATLNSGAPVRTMLQGSPVQSDSSAQSASVSPRSLHLPAVSPSYTTSSFSQPPQPEFLAPGQAQSRGLNNHVPSFQQQSTGHPQMTLPSFSGAPIQGYPQLSHQPQNMTSGYNAMPVIPNAPQAMYYPNPAGPNFGNQQLVDQLNQQQLHMQRNAMMQQYLSMAESMGHLRDSSAQQVEQHIMSQEDPTATASTSPPSVSVDGGLPANTDLSSDSAVSPPSPQTSLTSNIESMITNLTFDSQDQQQQNDSSQDPTPVQTGDPSLLCDSFQKLAVNPDPTDSSDNPQNQQPAELDNENDNISMNRSLQRSGLNVLNSQLIGSVTSPQDNAAPTSSTPDMGSSYPTPETQPDTSTPLPDQAFYQNPPVQYQDNSMAQYQLTDALLQMNSLTANGAYSMYPHDPSPQAQLVNFSSFYPGMPVQDPTSPLQNQGMFYPQQQQQQGAPAPFGDQSQSQSQNNAQFQTQDPNMYLDPLALAQVQAQPFADPTQYQDQTQTFDPSASSQFQDQNQAQAGYDPTALEMGQANYDSAALDDSTALDLSAQDAAIDLI